VEKEHTVRLFYRGSGRPVDISFFGNVKQLKGGRNAIHALNLEVTPPAGLLFGWIAPPALLREAATWFDPVYMQYNVLLVAFSVLIIPLITWVYVVRMRDEKRRRLELSLTTANNWNDANRVRVERITDEIFNFGNFFGSMSTLAVIVLFGSSILLLFKPMPFTPAADWLATGVDFTSGANFLTLGVSMTDYLATADPNSQTAYINQLVKSLTAFQF